MKIAFVPPGLKPPLEMKTTGGKEIDLLQRPPTKSGKRRFDGCIYIYAENKREMDYLTRFFHLAGAKLPRKVEIAGSGPLGGLMDTLYLSVGRLSSRERRELEAELEDESKVAEKLDRLASIEG